jgi:putative lipoprotein
MNVFINQFPKRIAWLLVVGLCMGCTAHTQNSGTTAMQKIEGSVWYRERMLLPNAEVYVALEDVARMDVPSALIASTRFTPRGGPPWDFSLTYDSARLNDKGRYALRARIEVDGRLMFINTTRIPAFDRDPGTPVKIMVSRVAGARTGKETTQARPDADLVNTYWKLTELKGQPASLGAGQKELHVVLSSEGNQVRGFSGCNRFSGTYEKKGSGLHFGPMAATMMACVESMQQEQTFLKALGMVQRYTINSDNLALYNAEEQLILRFKAVYLK